MHLWMQNRPWMQSRFWVQSRRSLRALAFGRSDEAVAPLQAPVASQYRPSQRSNGLSARQNVVERLTAQVACGVHERNMGERLREVTHLALRDGVVLFGEQTEIVAQPEQAFEQSAGVVCPPDHSEAVRHPERAGEERSLASGEAVDVRRFLRAVAEYETVFCELLLDLLDRRADPGISGRKEAEKRDHQQACIESVRSVVLGERPDLRVVALLEDLGVDRITHLSPLVDGSLEPELLDRADRPVDSHPGHDLRMGEVPARATHLPDAVVGLLPARLQEIHERDLQVPGRF